MTSTGLVAFVANVFTADPPDVPPAVLSGRVRRIKVPGGAADWTLVGDASPAIRRLFDGWRHLWVQPQTIGDMVTVQRLLSGLRDADTSALPMVGCGQVVTPDAHEAFRSQLDDAIATAAKVPLAGLAVSTASGVAWYGAPGPAGDVLCRGMDWSVVATVEGLSVHTDNGWADVSGWDDASRGTVVFPSPAIPLPDDATHALQRLSGGHAATVRPAGPADLYETMCCRLATSLASASLRGRPLLLDASERASL
jgi:hypothetical protein